MARRAPDALKDVIRDFRRDQILDTARRLFGDRGTTEVSMDEIAQEAGVARSTVYVYFANRDELLQTCVQSMYDQIKETISGLFEDDVAAPLDRLHALLLGVLERIDENPAFFRLAMATQFTATASGSAAVGGALMWIGLDVIRPRIMSWIGHARHANTYRLRTDLFRRIPFQRAAAKPSSASGRDVQQSTGERPLGEP